MEKQRPPDGFSDTKLFWVAWVLKWTRMKIQTLNLRSPLPDLPIYPPFALPSAIASTVTKPKFLPIDTIYGTTYAHGFSLKKSKGKPQTLLRFWTPEEERDFQFTWECWSHVVCEWFLFYDQIEGLLPKEREQVRSNKFNRKHRGLGHSPGKNSSSITCCVIHYWVQCFQFITCILAWCLKKKLFYISSIASGFEQDQFVWALVLLLVPLWFQLCVPIIVVLDQTLDLCSPKIRSYESHNERGVTISSLSP